MQKNKWWLEPSTWQQHDAIAKHYQLRDKREAALIYPTKGEATAAIKASYFRSCLEHCVTDAVRGRLTEFSQLREYFVDDSEGGQDNLGKRDLKSIWEYVKIYIRK